MEAKDTAIKIRKSVELPEDHSLLSMIDFADKVAEVSFKIGKTDGVAESLQPALKAVKESHKAGRKEVVEFIGRKPFEHNTTNIYPYHHLDDCFACKYEAKLKDWGIE